MLSQLRSTRKFALRAVAWSALSVAALGAVPARGADEAKKMEHGKSMAGMNMPKSWTELMKMDPEECMKMMDHGNKGYITKKEFMKFQEDLWKSMDRNRDQKVSRDEWTNTGA